MKSPKNIFVKIPEVRKSVYPEKWENFEFRGRKTGFAEKRKLDSSHVEKRETRSNRKSPIDLALHIRTNRFCLAKSFPSLFSIFGAFSGATFPFKFFSGTSWNTVPILVDFRYSFVGRKVYFCPRKFPKLGINFREPLGAFESLDDPRDRPCLAGPSGRMFHLGSHRTWRGTRVRHETSEQEIIGLVFLFFISNITPKLFFLQL